MTLLATLTLDNTSAGLVASGFVAPMFGHPFKQGDVPSGSYPRFELADSTVCPHTMFSVSRWPDGSLRFAAFLLRVPTGIVASSTIPINLLNTGTSAHGASSRALSECASASTDLAVEVVGLDGLSGTWASNLNQGITDGDVEIIGNGPAGLVAKVRQEFRQSGANHGQLECFWYVALLQDASGNLAGIRYLGKVTQPWYNVDTPAKGMRSFSSFLVKNGAATVRDCWAARSGVTQTLKYPTTLTNVPSGERAKWIETVGALTMEHQTLVRLAGTTPTGLATSTSYFINRDSFTGHVGLYTDCGLGDSAMVAPSGTGDFTMVAYPYLTHFGSLYTAGPTARWDYIQAGGSIAADAPVRVKHDSAYWQGSGMVPSYASTSVAAQPEYGYEPNSMMPITRYIGTTGERGDIGVLPDWHVKHLISQRAADETTIRGIGLKNAHAPIALYDSATKSIKPVNNLTYTGMPASSTSFRWTGDALHTSGFANPPGNLRTGLSSLFFDHMPALSAYPYMVTGEPQFLDTLVEMASSTVMSGYTPSSTLSSNNGTCERNAVINGVNYYAVVAFNLQARTGAWALREIGFASSLLPEGHKYKQYFVDLNTNNYAAMRAFHDNLATDFWKSSGLQGYSYEGIMSPWQISYRGMAMAQAYRMTKDANALFMLNHLVKWWDSIRTAHGAWHATSYRQIVRLATTDGAVPTSMDQVAYAMYSASWDAATGLMTVAPQAGGYAPQNGDVLMWDRNSSGTGFGEGAAPAGLLACTAYYLMGKSGNTFQLAATPGGAAITFTDTRSTSTYVRMANAPLTSCIGGVVDAAGYLSNMRGMLKTAKAAGATVSQPLIDDFDARLTAVSYASDPRYNFSDAGPPVLDAYTPPPPSTEPMPFFGGALGSLPLGVTWIAQDAAGEPTPSEVTSVTITPTTATGSTTFSATVNGANDPSQEVTWASVPAGMVAAGVFTAPAQASDAQVIIVTARSVQNPAFAASATVTIAALPRTPAPAFVSSRKGRGRSRARR